jgi:biotin transport system substrate-specific component
MLAGLTLGIATIYAGGVSWLLILSGGTLQTALMLGVLPFIAGDVTKVLLAFFAAKSLRGTSFGRL